MSELAPVQGVSDFEHFLAAGGATTLAAQKSPFMTKEWIDVWRRHFGSGCERMFVLGGADGREGILFAQITKESYRGVTLRVLRSYVNSHSVRAALYVGAEPSQVAKRLAASIESRHSEWDVLRLQGIAGETDFAQSLCDALRQLDCPAQIERTWSHDGLRFPDNWAEYYQGLSKETRRVRERMRRRLSELGNLTTKKCRSPDELRAGFAAFVELERRSWKADSGEVIDSKPSVRDFYADIVELFGSTGRCEIDLLYLNEHCVCALLSILYKGQTTTLKSSFDAAFAKYSPGWQLFRFVLEDCFMRSIKEVDFYADLEFSKRWATTRYPFCDVIAFSPSWRGRMARVAKTGIGLLRQTRRP